MAIPEVLIQRTILDGLAYLGIVAWRNQAIPVPRRVGGRIVGLRRADPHTIGIPDIFAILPGGRLLGIEVKSEIGRMRPEQIEWKERLEKAGALHLVARRWDDVQKFFIQNGLYFST